MTKRRTIKNESTDSAPDSGVLSADEPAPFRVLQEGSSRAALLVCDHASRRFPASLGDMGVDPAVRRCHLALDIGAGALTETLSERLAATAVLQQYSRLVVDCNRELLDPGAFLEFGDGVVIPGNRRLTPDQKLARAEAIYWPYHHAISGQVARLSALGPGPAMYSIHSFTPVLNGVSRSWEIGILWDSDERLSRPMIDAFREAGFKTGDNEPYSGKAPQDFTIDHHAEPAGLPHVGIEIRQDLIREADGVRRIADVMVPMIERIQQQVFPAEIGKHPGRKPA